MRDFAANLAVAVDAAAINGSGAAGQPTGILQTTGIGTVTGTGLTYDGCLEFQSDVLSANALVNSATCGYVAPVATAKLLANRQKFTGTDATLWSGNLADGQIAGFPAMFANFATGVIGVRAIYSVDIGLRYAGSFSVATVT